MVPTADIDAPTLSAGETGTLRIEAQHVESIYWRELYEEAGVHVDWHEPEKVEPPFTTINESYPPIWRWGECVDVDVEFSVRVAEGTNPGEYTYEVAMSPDHQRGDWVTFEYVIQSE